MNRHTRVDSRMLPGFKVPKLTFVLRASDGLKEPRLTIKGRDLLVNDVPQIPERVKRLQIRHLQIQSPG